MKIAALILTLTVIITISLPPSGEASTGRSLDVTSLIIKFDKTDAKFTVNYDLGKISRMYIILFGSRSIEPKIKDIFSNFDYDIIKMDQDKSILWVKNISRFEKGYYLHDSKRFGASISTVYIYTPDYSRAVEYTDLNATPNKFYTN